MSVGGKSQGNPKSQIPTESLLSNGKFSDVLVALYASQQAPQAASLIRDAWREGGNLEKAWEWSQRTDGGALRPDERLRAAWEAERRREADRLRANLAAAGRGNVYSPDLEKWLEDPVYDARTAWVREGGGIVWLREEETGRLKVLSRPPSADRAAFTRDLARSGNPLVVFGRGGEWIDAARTALAEHPAMFLTMRRPATVVAPDLPLFLLALRVLDLTDLLGAPDLFWFVGDGWEEAMRRVFVQDLFLPLPDSRMIVPAPSREVARALSEAARIREADAGRARERAWPEYARRTRADWRKAFSRSGPGEGPRVLFITSRFTTVLQYVVRDLSEAFASLGCPVETLIEPTDCRRVPWPAVAAALDEFRPDLLVQLDHLRGEHGGALPPSVPFACWIQDRLPNLFNPKFISQQGAGDFVFAMWEGIRRDCLAAGYPEVLRLGAAANTFVYGAPARVRSEYACDVAFVSNITPPTPEPRYPGLVERAAEILTLEGIGYRDTVFYQKLLDRIAREKGFSVPDGDRARLVERVLAFDVERFVQRTEPLRWARAMGLDVKVWGSGWDRLGEFAPVARGPVRPGEDLRDLYRSARIHLHANSDTNVHPRVFECLAAGGFLLAWRHPTDGEPGGLAEHLAVGREVETFASRADFEEKVRGFLVDEGRRNAVVQAGRRRVLAEHTMVRRAEAILDAVRARLA